MTHTDHSYLLRILRYATKAAGLTLRSYSGRGMAEESCIAVSGSEADIARPFYYIGRDPDAHPSIAEAYLFTFSQDAMGRDTIIYWTQLTCGRIP